jgi:hypothetical protein
MDTFEQLSWVLKCISKSTLKFLVEFVEENMKTIGRGTA